MSLRTVVVVEDGADVRRLVVSLLEADGFRAVEATDGEEALAAVAEHSPDLVILDLGLPRVGGIEVLARLRQHSSVAVIVLSARSEEADRVLALELGADDYVSKPFSPRELLARVHAVLRRQPESPTDTAMLHFDGLEIDLGAREVRVDGDVVGLRNRQFGLLAFLASSPRQVFSREQLLRAVWNSSAEWQDDRTVTEHVRRLRVLIERDPESPRWLVTVRGAGYRFEP